ncbi:MAG: response regulator, partial [Deltaproteobacteria bacterium]|nr:response regulator [Deltaproteobacteria bacterium]
LSQESYIQKARAQRDFVLASVVNDHISGTPVIYCAYPVFASNNDLVGVIVAGLSLNKILSPIPGLSTRTYSSAVLLDEKGFVLFSMPENSRHIGAKLEDTRWQYIDSLVGNELDSSLIQGADGRERLLTVKRLSQEYLLAPYINIMLEAGTENSFAHAYAGILRKMMFMGLAALLGLTLAAFLSRCTLLRPLQHMMGNIHSIQKGDFSARAALTGLGGEMGELGLAFEQMTQNLEQHEATLVQAKQETNEANRIKNEFLANISHEIRTPMNAIIGMAYMTLKTKLDDKQKNYLNKIYNSGNALLSVINDILDFSRLENGKLRIDQVSFQLDDIFSTIRAMFASSAEEKRIEMLFYISPSVPQHLKGDPLRINQILANVISNAVKFTEKGEIMVSCSVLHQQNENSPKVELSFVVQDTGIGIEEERMPLLFKPFTQTDGSLTRHYGGTGLGLVIAKSLVELMGGKINLESSPHHGTKVSFTLNLEENLNKASRISSPRVRGMRVLLVDDNETARQVIGSMLISFSFKAETTSSANEAFQLLSVADEENNPYHLVLLDWRMPEIDGVEAAGYISHHMRLRCKPVLILITAFGQVEDHDLMVRNGITSLIHKPVGPSQLLDSILDALDSNEGTPLPPAKDAADCPPVSSAGTKAPSPPPENLEALHGASILLIEDNLKEQKSISALLEGAGMQVTLAGNSRIAMNLLNSGQKFHLALVDMQMASLDGYTVTKQIRQNHSLDDMPLVALRDVTQAGESEEELLRLRISEQVSKPLDANVLLNRLAHWLQKTIAGGRKYLPAAVPASSKDLSICDLETANLPGLNFKKALAMFENKKKLLDLSIRQFVQNHADDHKLMEEALQHGKTKDAARYAHTLKSLCTSIGAEQLSEQFADLETALDKKEVDYFDVRPDLRKASENMALTVELLKDMLARQDSPECVRYLQEQNAGVEKTKKNILSPEALDILHKLHDLMKDDDAHAQTFLVAHLDTLKKECPETELDTLERMVNQFDFEEAMQVLDKII